jgi:RimJ/RimL family protein N-acetyltransferase
MIRGEKVGLREVRRSDLANFLQWFNDPEVTQYLSMSLPMTEMAEEKWVEGLAERAGTHAHFVIVALDDSTEIPIGTIGLDTINNKDHNAAFGIAIGDKDYWNKGYGTEAARLIIDYGFGELNLHRINSNVYEFNERSRRMHLRVGFIEEGRQRELIYRKGRYRDLVMLGILKEEWEATKNR